MFLRVFYQSAFEIGVRAYDFFNVNYFVKDAGRKELFAFFVASVYIYCADKCLECVAVNVAVVLTTGIVLYYKFVEPKFQCYYVKCFAAHKAAA